MHIFKRLSHIKLKKKLLTTKEKVTGLKKHLFSITIMQEFLRTTEKYIEKHKVLLSAPCSFLSVLNNSQDINMKLLECLIIHFTALNH